MYTFYVIIITTTPFFACSFLFLSLQSITTLAYVKKSTFTIYAMKGNMAFLLRG